MKKKLETLTKTEFGYGIDGCDYDTIEDLIQVGIFDFCGCGNPSSSLEYVLGGLELVTERRKAPEWGSDRDASNLWWKQHEAKELGYFGSENARYFFWYWASSVNLTEHGSSVPGWLTPEGEKVLDILREWRKIETESKASE